MFPVQSAQQWSLYDFEWAVCRLYFQLCSGITNAAAALALDLTAHIAAFSLASILAVLLQLPWFGLVSQIQQHVLWYSHHHWLLQQWVFLYKWMPGRWCSRLSTWWFPLLLNPWRFLFLCILRLSMLKSSMPTVSVSL
jgi:hypothetical protein